MGGEVLVPGRRILILIERCIHLHMSLTRGRSRVGVGTPPDIGLNSTFMVMIVIYSSIDSRGKRGKAVYTVRQLDRLVPSISKSPTSPL
jgi:hypothetical protein